VMKFELALGVEKKIDNPLEKARKVTKNLVSISNSVWGQVSGSPFLIFLSSRRLVSL